MAILVDCRTTERYYGVRVTTAPVDIGDSGDKRLADVGVRFPVLL